MSGIRFDRTICGNSADAFQREWLETNGLGGFASSTIVGANTRRYHGLLIAATQPPAVRCLLLSKLEETLIAGDRRFDLSTNLYPGCMHPEGYQYLREFRMGPFPTFVFEAGGITIEKHIYMVHGENTVVVEYEAEYDAPGDAANCRLELRPLIAFRGYHDLTHENSALNGDLKQSAGLFSIQPYSGLPDLYFAHNARALERLGHWYFRFEYPVERDRGLDYQEDLFCPCVLEFDLAPHQPAVVIASTVVHEAGNSVRLKAAEMERRGKTSGLSAAADQFLVRRGALHTVIAGYPWFTDWARDTMISLPGLTLVNTRFDIAKDILLAFAGHLNQGMLPNRFPDARGLADDTPEYNTVDATLWFFEAIRVYLECSKDAEFVRAHLYERLNDIIEWHIKGTRFGIHADADGLLIAGDPTTQLTWMDARVDGRPVTPRNGKPVEIQALWYNAVCFTARLAKDFGDETARLSYENLAAKIAKNFNASFWNEDAGCLYDVIDGAGEGEHRDASLRPNQVIALSLGYCAIPKARARRILTAVESALLTPFGLRTLAPSDPAYCGCYEGGTAGRDAAYHQGTVWPWLLGPFVTADLRFNGEAARQRVSQLISPLLDFARTRGTGHIPEIFDGNAPHEPRGCFSQAWSVAEILRISSISA